MCSCVFLSARGGGAKKVSDTSLVFLSGVASLKKKKRKEITPRFTTHSDRLASLIEREKIV